jgi:replicative DNA helicase
MISSIEKLILENLLYNESYMRRVVPFIREEYFSDKIQRKIFSVIQTFCVEFNKCPTKDVLDIRLSEDKTLSQGEYDKSIELINELSSENNQEEEWLIQESEKFCKDKAIYNAIMDSIQIIDGKDKDRSPNALPQILSEALGVSFDTHIGHDYLEDAEARYDFYHNPEEKLPFDIDYLNVITKGGTPKKTLNVIMAGTNVGKSMFLCHHAAHCLRMNKNVLYITLEMAEELIAERIDANILDMTMDDIRELPKTVYAKKLFNATKGVQGKLIIKEYPTGQANANHFRHLLDELNLKKKFVPDIIFIDYLNICASARYKASSSVNSFTLVKAIAEEIRGLAKERNVPVWTATQTNRTGFQNSDPEMTDTAESFGLPQTSDFMIALVTTEDLEKLDQLMVKQLKNRYNSKSSNKRFVIGVNYAKMKLFDVDPKQQLDFTINQEEDDEEIRSPSLNKQIKSKFKTSGWSNT